MRKNRILLILILIALILIGASIVVQLTQSGKVWEESSKVLMTLGATVVLGGLLKFLLEDFKKELEKEEKRKEFTKELIAALRKIYDDVELSRVLIESHKSAKTYGERIRMGIIPAKISLYNIKRTIADKHDFLTKEERLRVRLSIHFMIAYLQSLVQEYQHTYFKLSNLQSYQEKIKEKSKSIFADILIKEGSFNLDDYENLKKINQLFDDKNKKNQVPDRLLTVWKEIDSLNYLNDFLDAGNDSKYDRLFISQYYFCKKLIRKDKSERIPSPFDSLERKYVGEIEENDKKMEQGEYVPEFDLVLDIFKNEIG